MEKKEIYTPGLVLGILSIPGGLLLAIVGWVLGIVGIVLNAKNKETKSTTAGLVLSIIGLVLAILNSILGVIIYYSVMG